MQFKTKTIDHNGEPIHLPFVVHSASSVHLYSLFNYEFACSLCEKENFKPIALRTSLGEKKAAGFISAINNVKTSLVPYFEWSLGIFVIPNDREMPEVNYKNETSLFFQSILDNEQVGDITFCPKLFLNEQLPTEIGLQYYGIPKEVGKISYNYSHEISDFSVSTLDNFLIMNATFPTKRGALSKFGLLVSLFRAYGFSPVLKSLSKKEFSATLVGSAKILAKKAYMKIKNDPNTQMFSWDENDCKLEINSKSEWGNVLQNLQVEPQLICHVPNLQYEFSEPFDQ